MFVVKDPSENRFISEQLRKREWNSYETEVENDPAAKKSRPCESSVNDVNQSTSANNPSVNYPVSEQQPGTSQQSVRYDSGNSLSSGGANAKQHGNNAL